MRTPIFVLFGAVCALGSGQPPTGKQVTDVGNWKSVTLTPSQTLRTTWNFGSFFTTCGPEFPAQVSIFAEGIVPRDAILVRIPELGVAYYGNYRFLVWSAYRAYPGLSEARFGFWDQYAQVVARVDGDVFLSPWQGSTNGAVIGYLYNSQNSKLAQAMVNVLLGGDPKNEMVVDTKLLPETGDSDHTFTLGGQGTALNAGSAIQAAAANADGSCFAYGQLGRVLWIH